MFIATLYPCFNMEKLRYTNISAGVLDDFQLLWFFKLTSPGKKEMDFPWPKCNFHFSRNRPAFIQLQ